MNLSAEAIVEFLQENPEFFEDKPGLLEQIAIPHPHGGRAISLAERQQLQLREKNKLLESKLRELLQFGEENDAIGEKVHRFSLSLLTARTIESLLPTITLGLRDDFAVPHVALRIWAAPAQAVDQPEFSEVSAELRAFADTLVRPYCDTQPPFEIPSWFGDSSDQLKSFAVVALRSEHAFGLLVLASEDAQRFYPEMGTLYLKRIGELATVALMPYINEDKDAA
jgi:uncharacterized protein YigA (DUF484 family)